MESPKKCPPVKFEHVNDDSLSDTEGIPSNIVCIIDSILKWTCMNAYIMR